MPSIIRATTTSGLQVAPDNSGSLQLQTNGTTTAVTIDTSQNVGIGTTTPTEKLEIVASSPASLLTSNSTTGYSILRLRNTATSGRTYEWALGGSNTGAQSGAMYLYDGTAAAVRMQIDSSGNLQFNSGYGSAATAYGCRAWVNFDGTSNTANVTGTYSQSGTTVTVTITNHGYITGNTAYLDFTTGTAVDGAYTVTVTDANTFTVTQASRTTSGNVTDRRNTIRGSGNVTSITDNGTGYYTVNFTTAMPDANYALTGTAQHASLGYLTVGSNGGTYLASTSSVRFQTGQGATEYDAAFVQVAILR